MKGLKTSFETGLFINGKFRESSDGKTIDVSIRENNVLLGVVLIRHLHQVINPTTGKKITAISEGNAKDIDDAVDAAQKAFDSSWGLKVPGFARGKLLMKLATLIEEHVDELAALEALDNGKAFSIAKGFDIVEGAACLRYYGGWADKSECLEFPH